MSKLSLDEIKKLVQDEQRLDPGELGAVIDHFFPDSPAFDGEPTHVVRQADGLLEIHPVLRSEDPD